MSLSPRLVHVLNQALITEIMSTIERGDLARLQDLGIEADDAAMLQLLSSTAFARLCNCTVPMAEVSVNRTVLRNVVRQLLNDSNRDERMVRAMNLGASYSLLEEFFGLNSTEAASVRRLQGIQISSGRQQMPSEEQEKALWERWHEVVQPEAAESTDAFLEAMCRLTEEARAGLFGPEQALLSLASCWHLVSGWIEDERLFGKGVKAFRARHLREQSNTDGLIRHVRLLKKPA
ncbi:hypothetical protein WH50_03420 [Pokkaliibacter plantistimulans]|uniref:DUF2857 domain-containing protein n=1 Tax=Pokkaliibacter plantistimulans TaxID=1635171 RepID=A0ABX5M2P9_9GAMM|nr:STY4526/YPO1902 family pathogenicity island replication protein [Pokkaliibacter plantistimulans]PXF32639.1 hypothetical protein WH50_03420 [Pokkaliibacter plantistimulans]